MKRKEPHVEPTDYDTNPYSKTFFAGASFEHKARVLQQVAPAKFKAVSTLLDAALRKAFLTIRPDPAAAKGACSDGPES